MDKAPESEVMSQRSSTGTRGEGLGLSLGPSPVISEEKDLPIQCTEW